MSLEELCPGADFLLAVSSACEIDAATFEVSMAINSQDIKKQFQRQLKVLLHKQTLLYTIYMEEKSFIFFLGEK